MTAVIYAPWTEAQVSALNRFQKSGVMHSFTCRAHTSVDLTATGAGWVCSSEGCESLQQWAHAFMADPDWLAEAVERRRVMFGLASVPVPEQEPSGPCDPATAVPPIKANPAWIERPGGNTMTAMFGSGIRCEGHLLIASPFTDRTVHGLRLGTDGFMWDSEATEEWDWPRRLEWTRTVARHRRWGWLESIPIARRWAPRPPRTPASMTIFASAVPLVLTSPIEFIGSDVHLTGATVDFAKEAPRGD